MPWRLVLAPALVLLCGCTGIAPPPPAPGSPAWGAPQAMSGALPNPLFVPARDPAAVWETVVDVVDDYFRIREEVPVRLVGTTVTEGRLETYPDPGATLLEPWRGDSVGGYERLESTLQSIRRWVRARVTPGQGGYWIDIAVFKQLEDAVQPFMSTAGAATFRYDSTLTRLVNPVGEQEVNRGWIDYGRDCALEQRILGHLQDRLAGCGAPLQISELPQTAPAAATR